MDKLKGGFEALKALKAAKPGLEKSAAELAQRLAAKRIEGVAGAGGSRVTVIFDGHSQIQSVSIGDEVAKKQKSIVEALVKEACNNGYKQVAEEAQKEHMNMMMGMLGDGNLMGMLGKLGGNPAQLK